MSRNFVRSYGSEIRQFHAVQVAGSPTPEEDPNTEAYVLGLSPEPSIYSSNPKYGSGSLQLAKKEALIPSTLGGSEGVGLDESGRYLVQVWEGGSICDKTGLPRTVEVQVSRSTRFRTSFSDRRRQTADTTILSQFHCNTQTIDRIALIRETSSELFLFTTCSCLDLADSLTLLLLSLSLRTLDPHSWTLRRTPLPRRCRQELGTSFYHRMSTYPLQTTES